jgi:hypothetical protein
MPRTIELAKTCGRQLQGETLGKKHYARVCELLTDANQGEIVLLDFKGVDVVTGSWINAMIVPLYRRVGEPEIDLYPILCNTGNDWLDDLALLAKWTHQCYLVAEKCTTAARSARLIGSLDPGQRAALAAVIDSGEVTGAELERQGRGERIGATAWNNRLKDLHGKRLLRRTKRGREQVYAPLLEVIQTDG